MTDELLDWSSWRRWFFLRRLEDYTGDFVSCRSSRISCVEFETSSAYKETARLRLEITTYKSLPNVGSLFDHE
jgi:hypothetical protein